jgi:Tol biopolymer transport system component
MGVRPLGTARAGTALGGAAVLAAALTVALPAGASPGAPAAAPVGKTTRVSLDSKGRQTPTGQAFAPSVSANGRWVAFDSDADSFVPNDTNERTDIFVRDTRTGRTSRVSVSSSGGQADAHSFTPSISGDGRWVAFVSDATNLVPGDTNGGTDVFLHDRRSGRTTRMSVAIDGRETEGGDGPAISANGRFVVYNAAKPLRSIGTDEDLDGTFVYDTRTRKRERIPYIGGEDISISSDGRFIAFASEARDLVPNDKNRKYDCFVYDRKARKMRLVSVNSKGGQGNGESTGPEISSNGRYVGFASSASNLVAGDTNKLDDVFVHDLRTGRTTRVSVTAKGKQAQGGSGGPVLSVDGRYVAYLSAADITGRGSPNPTFFDVYLLDRRTKTVVRANVSPTGQPANGPTTSFPAISDNGRHVAFSSRAGNLVPGDTNGVDDVFVRSYKG